MEIPTVVVLHHPSHSGEIPTEFQLPSRRISGTVAGEDLQLNQVPNHKSHLLTIYIICHLPLVFLSPTSQKFAIFIRPLFRSPFFRQTYPLLAIMSDFGMAPTDDGLTPKIGRMGNLDAKTFILGRRYPKGIDNPFYTSGCEYLLFVCRGCLRCVAWFS